MVTTQMLREVAVFEELTEYEAGEHCKTGSCANL